MRPNTTSRNPLARFLAAPIEARSYTNLLYLALAFPLGLSYFIFLVVGLALGFGLLIIWLGIPILALVLAGIWGFSALERQMAIHLLGAEVPPMSPPLAESAEVSLWTRLKAFLANPVTWKGMGYMLVKLPLGVFTFFVVVFLLAFSGGLIAAPFVYPYSSLYMGPVVVDTLNEALVCALFGMVLALVSLNLFNGLAWLWGKLAEAMLGSERYAAVPVPATVPAALPEQPRPPVA